MKKFKLWHLIGLFSLLVLILFLIVLFFLNRIESELYNLIFVYGYLAIFSVSFVVDILAQPIGPELPLIAAKTIGLDMILTSLLIIIGSTLASFFSYKIGKIFYPRLCRDKKCEKYFSLYKRYGKYGLLVASLGPVPYVPFCWFSGAFGLPIKQFIYFGILPRAIRIISVSFILILLF